jgi:ATP-dependent exoDNAse (exonuclease V) beta subunit
LEHKVNQFRLLLKLDGETILRIYDASAGSGKTYALVKEYLRLFSLQKKNDAYRNITFTNKAVHEMKSRIVGSLSEFAKTILLKSAGINAGL